MCVCAADPFGITTFFSSRLCGMPAHSPLLSWRIRSEKREQELFLSNPHPAPHSTHLTILCRNPALLFHARAQSSLCLGDVFPPSSVFLLNLKCFQQLQEPSFSNSSSFTTPLFTLPFSLEATAETVAFIPTSVSFFSAL